MVDRSYPLWCLRLFFEPRRQLQRSPSLIECEPNGIAFCDFWGYDVIVTVALLQPGKDRRKVHGTDLARSEAPSNFHRRRPCPGSLQAVSKRHGWSVDHFWSCADWTAAPISSKVSAWSRTTLSYEFLWVTVVQTGFGRAQLQPPKEARPI